MRKTLTRALVAAAAAGALTMPAVPAAQASARPAAGTRYIACDEYNSGCITNEGNSDPVVVTDSGTEYAEYDVSGQFFELESPDGNCLQVYDGVVREVDCNDGLLEQFHLGAAGWLTNNGYAGCATTTEALDGPVLYEGCVSGATTQLWVFDEVG
jgi:hypothetical protein